ncbi:unnamed protein product [Cladocopium goreaui]|uniref:RAS small GTpases RIC1/ypt1, putative n=1 Tax=Cladocopium goreaui TaxID=2562237 RepID=A0A9P1DLK2_9DINO|nr:unnamed protein product [Cladocopium goreaui]
MLMKFIVLGDTGVGKSCLLLRFADGVFQDNYLCTIGVDFKLRRLNLDGLIAKVHVWDMAGQRRFRVCHPNYQGIGGVVIIFDITDRESFNNVVHWAEEICVMLIGNKTDLEHRRVVSFQEAGRVGFSQGVA